MKKISVKKAILTRLLKNAYFEYLENVCLCKLDPENMDLKLVKSQALHHYLEMHDAYCEYFGIDFSTFDRVETRWRNEFGAGY